MQPPQQQQEQPAAGAPPMPPPREVLLPAATGDGTAPQLHHSKAMQVFRPPVLLPPVATVPTKRVGRKGGSRRGPTAGAQEAEELVKLGPEISRNSERLRTGWCPVQLSSEDKAAEVVLNDKQLTASSSAGYRMVRATHGAFSGTWYFEVRVDRLGPSGAVRLGWSTRQAEVNAPVGADKHGFGYCSMQGSKVHAAWRDDYGEPFGEGDIVGCLLHMPEGGRPFEKGAADVVKYKGKLYFQEGEQAEPLKLPGSFVAFTLNGKLQGKAFGDILEGTYSPSISLYTNQTQQREPATATVNFGEHGFAFELPQLEGCPPPRPAFELAGSRTVQAQQQQQQQEPGELQQKQQEQELQHPQPSQQH